MFLQPLRPDSHRRKWDKDEFEKLARERLREEEAESGPSTSKGASKRDHSDDEDEDGNAYDNLVRANVNRTILNS